MAIEINTLMVLDEIGGVFCSLTGNTITSGFDPLHMSYVTLTTFIVLLFKVTGLAFLKITGYRFKLAGTFI